MLRKLSRFLFGYDVFISYPYAGGKAYARALQQQLINLDYEPFLDEEELAYGEALKSSLKRAIRRSRVLVLVGTKGALTAPYVNLEVAAALSLRRAVVPIDIDRIRGSSPWPELVDIPWVEEPTASAVEPSAAVLEQVRRLFLFRRRNSITRRFVSAAAVVFLVLAVSAVLQWREAVAQRRVAEEQRNEAITQRGIAEQQTIAARSNLAATRYALAGVESEERGNPLKAFLHASAAVENAPDGDRLLDVYIRRAEQLALALPRAFRITEHADAAAFSASLETAAITDQGRLRMADLRTGETWDITNAQTSVASFTIPAVSPDGMLVAAGTGLDSAATWHGRRDQPLRIATPMVILRGTPQSHFYFSPDGRTALGWIGIETGDEDGQHVEAAWDAVTGAPRSTAALRTVFRFGEMTWSRNAVRNWAVIVVDRDAERELENRAPQLQVIDVSSGSPRSPRFGPTADEAEIISLGMSANGDWVMAAERRKAGTELRLYSARDGMPANPPSMSAPGPVHILDLSTDGRKVLTVAGEQGAEAKLQLWDYGKPSYPFPYRELASLTTPRLWVQLALRGQIARFAEDASVVVGISTADLRMRTADDQQTPALTSTRFLLWDIDTARVIQPPIGIPGDVRAWRVARSGQQVGAITVDGTALVWDLLWQHRQPASALANVMDRKASFDAGWLASDLRAASFSDTTRSRILTYGVTEGVQTPIVLPNVKANGPPGARPIFRFSPDGKQYAVNAIGVEIRATENGALVRRLPLAERSYVEAFGFTKDGRAVAVAGTFSNREGKTVTGVQQWDLDTGKTRLARPLEVPMHEGTVGTEWRVAGITGDGQHFFTVSPNVVGSAGIAWAKATRMRVWALDGRQLIEFRFRPESPAPPWLVGALLHAARGVTVEPDGALRVDLTAASIRARATGAGAIVEHVDGGTTFLAPPGPVDDAFTPPISNDGRWVAVVPPDRRTVRIWSTLTRQPSSQYVLESKPFFAAGFSADGTSIVYIQGNGATRAAYAGFTRTRKPEWSAAMAVALTGARLSGSGYSLEWLTESELRTQRHSLLEMLRTASRDDRGASLILERWHTWLERH